MPKQIALPESLPASITDYLNKTASIADLAKRHGVAKATVLKWFDAAGIERHSRWVMISVKMTGKPGGRKGVKHSEETKKKLSEARKGKPTTLGFKFSEESKAKMREAARARWANYVKPAKTPKPLNMAVALQKQQLAKPIKHPKVGYSREEAEARRRARYVCKTMLRRLLTMPRVNKDTKVEAVLGYKKADLMAHLESQFRDGMSWDVRDSFHIDHIKPYAQFFSEGVFDPSVINALSNLQPLTPDENRKKGTSFDPRNRKQALIIDKSGTRPFTQGATA